MPPVPNYRTSPGPKIRDRNVAFAGIKAEGLDEAARTRIALLQARHQDELGSIPQEVPGQLPSWLLRACLGGGRPDGGKDLRCAPLQFLTGLCAEDQERKITEMVRRRGSLTNRHQRLVFWFSLSSSPRQSRCQQSEMGNIG